MSMEGYKEMSDLSMDKLRQMGAKANAIVNNEVTPLTNNDPGKHVIGVRVRVTWKEFERVKYSYMAASNIVDVAPKKEDVHKTTLSLADGTFLPILETPSEILERLRIAETGVTL